MCDTPQPFKKRLLSLPYLGKAFRLLAALKNTPQTQQRTLALEEQLIRITALEEQMATLLPLEQQLNKRQQIFKLDMARVLARKQDIEQDVPPPPSQQPLAQPLDDLYIAFENQFRGSETEIKQQQSKYLPFLAAMAQNISEPLKVLDIGCGRGEWLHLLGDFHYQASGLDISQTMVDFCRLEGLQAEQGDALAYLAKQADCSLDVITAFHVIEHLTFEQMIGLFDQCLRVLKVGGKIIFETPNPENLTVGGYSFYLDPTHKNPLPPATVEFITRQRGYQQVDIFRYNPRDEVGEVTPLVEQWFCSPVDFAVIAEK